MIRECLSDNRTLSFPFPALQQVQIGDLLWWDAVNLVAKPAYLLPDLGSLALNQRHFASVFLGVASDQRLAIETSTGHASLRVVTLDGIFDCDCVSQVLEVGQYIGIDRNVAGSAYYNQQVNACVNNSTALAIGAVVQRSEGVAVTKARVRLISTWPCYHSILAANALSNIQSQVGTLLPPTSLAMDASYSQYLSMAATGAQTIRLPLEADASGLSYFFTNVGTGSATFVGSQATTIKGNGVVPASKTGIFWYDSSQASWVGLVSN